MLGDPEGRLSRRARSLLILAVTLAAATCIAGCGSGRKQSGLEKWNDASVATGIKQNDETWNRQYGTRPELHPRLQCIQTSTSQVSATFKCRLSITPDNPNTGAAGLYTSVVVSYDVTCDVQSCTWDTYSR
jgi:hypothetical protein